MTATNILGVVIAILKSIRISVVIILMLHTLQLTRGRGLSGSLMWSLL